MITSKTYSQHTPTGTVGVKGKARVEDVGTLHPDYKKVADSWQSIEDCINGESTVKSYGEKYLPRPSGMTRDINGNAAYDSYITRAHFPDFTSKFLSGLTGITKINPPKIKVPKSMEYLIEDCDGDGTPLDVFFFQSVRLSLKTGRHLIFVDVDQKKNRLKLVRYSAVELINWGVVKKVYNEKNADFFVLREQVNQSESIFSHDYKNQYRVLTTSDILGIEGITKRVFLSAVFDEDGVLDENIAIPELVGKRFEGLPVIVIGSTDLDIEPDQIPLLGVSKCALQMYMKDADLSNAMFLTCNPTLCMSGVSSDEGGMSGGEVLVGSNISITMEDPNARAYYTKTDASGLAEVRLSIKTYLEEAKHAGSALLSGDQKGVESGEALRIKAASTTASLSTVSQTTARGFEKALRYMAQWMNISENLVSVKVDSDYLDNMLTPEYINQLTKLFELNIISHESALTKLVEGQFLDEDFDIQKELKLVKKQKEETFEDFVNRQDVTSDPAIQGTSGLESDGKDDSTPPVKDKEKDKNVEKPKKEEIVK
jgi:hypothetical protein